MRKRVGAAVVPVAVVLAATALLAACGSSSHPAASNAPATSAVPATTGAAAPTTTSLPANGAPVQTPYGPSVGVRLDGTPGVSSAEEHRAEQLVEDTIAVLTKYPTPLQAYAAGYRSIGDSLTGDEHYVKWAYVDDGRVLDPSKPESLVYENHGNGQKVVAAMFMMPFGSRFTDVPNVGGALTQWHIHANLCLTDDPNQKLVAGITTAEGGCRPGTSKAGNTPMLHVWVVPNECGPFAALEGIGAGQVPEGQTRRCDTRYASVQ